MQLVWFRNDLRTFDHAALTAARQTNEAIVALFTVTETQWQQHEMADIKKQLIFAQLNDLSDSLAALNIPLIIEQSGDYHGAVDSVIALCQQHKINAVHASFDYELNEVKRDQLLSDKLAKRSELAHIAFHCYHDGLILAPGAVLKNDGTSYGVFSAFRKKWLTTFLAQPPQCLRKISACEQPAPLKASEKPTFVLAPCWPVTETDVINQLRQFCQQDATQYKQHRDFAALDKTSKLSPYFSLGVISPKQALHRLLLEQGDSIFDFNTDAGTWLSELIWREFYRHLCYFHPEISQRKSVKASYDSIHWENDTVKFEAWKNGETGFPIVDAGMRQLKQTGFMHNRLRMITASFLVKDLHIDWRWGESYFMQQLIDGDYASNNGGWQWCASTGHDAAPYFRIFNPTTQGERFDPEGVFVRQYCPELDKIPGKKIHQPHEYAKKAGLFLKYPKPIVDHKVARETTLSLYKSVG